MSKVTGPLLSITARGTIGGMITFTAAKGQAIVKGNRLINWNGYYFSQKEYESETIGQKAARGLFKQAVCNWKNFTEEQKRVYDDLAEGKPTTGQAIYFGQYIKENYNKLLFTIYWLLGYGLGFPLYLFTCGNIEQYMYAKKRGI